MPRVQSIPGYRKTNISIRINPRGEKLITIKAIINNHWQSLTIIDNHWQSTTIKMISCRNWEKISCFLFFFIECCNRILFIAIQLVNIGHTSWIVGIIKMTWISLSHDVLTWSSYEEWKKILLDFPSHFISICFLTKHTHRSLSVSFSWSISL